MWGKGRDRRGRQVLDLVGLRDTQTSWRAVGSCHCYSFTQGRGRGAPLSRAGAQLGLLCAQGRECSRPGQVGPPFAPLPSGGDTRRGCLGAAQGSLWNCCGARRGKVGEEARGTERRQRWGRGLAPSSKEGPSPPRGPEDPALSLPHLLSSEQDGIAPGLFQPLALILHPPLSPASQFRGFLAFWVCEGVGRPSEKGRWRHKRGSAVVAPVWGRPHRRHLGIPGPILPSSLLSRRTPSPAGSSGPRGTHYHHLGCPGLPWERSRGSPLSPPRASAAGDVPRLRGASALCSRAPGLANCTISAASGRPAGRGGQAVGEAGSGRGRRAASPLSPTPRVLAAQPASTCAVHLIYC